MLTSFLNQYLIRTSVNVVIPDAKTLLADTQMPFLLTDNITEVSDEVEETKNDEDYASSLLRKRKRSAEKSEYSALLRLVPPTSNDCERLFSKCKYVLTPERSSTLPIHFEELMFFKRKRCILGCVYTH